MNDNAIDSPGYHCQPGKSFYRTAWYADKLLIAGLFLLLLFAPMMDTAIADQYRESFKTQTEIEKKYIICVEIGKEKFALKQILKKTGDLGERRFKTLSEFTGKNYYVIKKKHDQKSLENLEKGDPGIRVFPTVYKYLTNSVPDDKKFKEQWCHSNPGNPGFDMASDTAWDITTGSSHVVVAVLDSGVDYTHPDLAANMWKNENEVPNNNIDDDGNGYIDDIYGIDTGDNDSDPMDYDNHGTHCAGIIGASGNNGIGVSGVNWHIKIMAIKGFEEKHDRMSTDMELEAIDYLLYMKTHENVNLVAVNASFGFSGQPDILELEAIEALGKAGILFIAAAGNKGVDTDIPASGKAHYPSSYDLDNILSVAASDKNGDLAWFSNYGHNSVDLAAPGQKILSTVMHTIKYEPDQENSLFYDNFETGDNNFTMEGTWAVTSENSLTPFHGLSDSPDARYKANTNYAVTSREIDLSGVQTHMALGFYAKHDIELEGSVFFDSLETWFFAPGTPGIPAGPSIVPKKWGITSDRAASGNYSWTESPDGEYPNNCEQWLLSPEVDLSLVSGNNVLKFKLTGIIEKKHDNLNLYFSKDSGSTWSDTMLRIDGNHSTWEEFSVSIPVEYLEKHFMAAFVVTSDKTVTNDGFYIDDIEITGDSGRIFYDGMENGIGQWREPGIKAVDPTSPEWEKAGEFAGSSNDTWKLYNYKIPEKYFWEGFKFRFVLSADWGTHKDGVYIDDIAVGVPKNLYSYEYFSGTSMAAPQVTGATALVASAFPGLGMEGIKQSILEGVIPADNLADKVLTGGNLNLFGALSDISIDSDNDTVPDYMDNCRLTKNPDQRDTDLDGYGNFCDCDLNNDNKVDLRDFMKFKSTWGGKDPDADFNGTDHVNLGDLMILRSRWGTFVPFE